jgi:hypothetical protein
MPPSIVGGVDLEGSTPDDCARIGPRKVAIAKTNTKSRIIAPLA